MYNQVTEKKKKKRNLKKEKGSNSKWECLGTWTRELNIEKKRKRFSLNLISHYFHKGHINYGYQTCEAILVVPGAKMNTEVGTSVWLKKVARLKRFKLPPAACSGIPVFPLYSKCLLEVWQPLLN